MIEAEEKKCEKSEEELICRDSVGGNNKSDDACRSK